MKLCQENQTSSKFLLSFAQCQVFCSILKFISFPCSCSSVLSKRSICSDVYSFMNDKRSIESICAECVPDLSSDHRIHYLAPTLTISIPVFYIQIVKMTDLCSKRTSVSFNIICQTCFYLGITVNINSFWKKNEFFSSGKNFSNSFPGSRHIMQRNIYYTQAHTHVLIFKIRSSFLLNNEDLLAYSCEL